MASTRITDNKARMLKYDPEGSKQQFLWDVEISGFGLEVRPTGKKSWVLSYRTPAGSKKRITLGRYPERSLTKMRELAREQKEVLAEGVEPIAARRTEDINTFQELHDAYRRTRHFKKLSEDFHNNFGSTMRCYVLPALGESLAAAIERPHVRSVVDGLVEAGKPGMAQGALTHMKVLFNFAIEKDIRQDNPCDRITIKKPKERPKTPTRKAWLQTDAELREAWYFDGKPAVRAMIRWLILTGCRRDEARTTEKAWVDREAGTWHVPETKNSRALILPLTEPMLAVADEMEKAYPWSTYLFPATTDGQDKPIPRGSMDYLVRARTDGQWSAHTLRHTVKTHMQELMVPKEWRDLVQNHVTAGMDRIYGHSPQLDLKRKALETWQKELMRRVAGA